MKILRITAKRDGFRRCGIAHRGVATDHPIDRFTKKQIETLKAEPMLVVQELEVDDPKPKGGKASGGGQNGGGNG